MGAEDFAFLAEAIPGYFYYVGMHNDSEGQSVSGHSPYFKVNENVLQYGAALHASLAATHILGGPATLSVQKESLHDEL